MRIWVVLREKTSRLKEFANILVAPGQDTRVTVGFKNLRRILEREQPHVLFLDRNYRAIISKNKMEKLGHLGREKGFSFLWLSREGNCWMVENIRGDISLFPLQNKWTADAILSELQRIEVRGGSRPPATAPGEEAATAPGEEAATASVLKLGVETKVAPVRPSSEDKEMLPAVPPVPDKATATIPSPDREKESTFIRSMLEKVENDNYFDILDVGDGASFDAITEKYKERVLQFSPESFTRETLEKHAQAIAHILVVLKDAYRVLTHPTIRDRYRQNL